MAPLRASSMPVMVSPIFMLDTSMAATGVSSCEGFSFIGLSFSFVCPRNVGVVSSVGLRSSVAVSYGWYSVSLFSMFFIVFRLSSMNLVGSVVSSSVTCGKLYLLVVGVYCGC